MTRRFTRRGLLAASAMTALAGCARDVTDGNTEPADETTVATTATTARTTVASDPSALDHDLSVEHDPETWAHYDPEWTAPSTAPPALEFETLVENLEIPWDLSFAGNGELFVTERTGRLLRYESGDVVDVASPSDAIDAGSVEPGADEGSWWVEGGEGGTMGVSAHPNYPDVPVVYLYYTANVGEDDVVNRLSAFDVTADDPAATEVGLLEAPADIIHNGGRIAFGPANYLWVCVGDANQKPRAADPSSLAGSVLRVTPEGDSAPGNPDRGGSADARIFTMGHRNPQGVNWLPDASPLAVEHGPAGERFPEFRTADLEVLRHRVEVGRRDERADVVVVDARADGEGLDGADEFVEIGVAHVVLNDDAGGRRADLAGVRREDAFDSLIDSDV